MPSVYDHANLSSMPIEVIKMILYWLHRLSLTQQDDENEEFESPWEENQFPRLRKFLKPIEGFPLKLNDMRSLASVDRSFYHKFSALVFESFDIESFPPDESKLTLDEIIKSHSVHIKEIRGRVSFPDQPYGDPRLRSELLLKILKSCPRITDIDIDLDPKPLISTANPETLDSTNNQFPDLFIKPISQLTSLTHLSLSTPHFRQTPYTETFLVELLSNISGLQGFSCSRIEAVHPMPSTDRQACQSQLGIHLASLTHLVELELEKAECLDVSWNQLKWKSSLKALSLTNCGRVSVKVLGGFAELFKSTLTTLTFARTGLYEPDNLTSDPLPTKKFRFKLPELINLEIISSASVRFAKGFEHSKKLSWLSLGNYPLHRHQNLEDLINEQLWPDLKKLELTSSKTYSIRAIEGLEDSCERDGIRLILNVDLVDDDSFEEDDMY
ncbi:uncharacterized protein MELLADRAFT_87041 [Melampsora larici-populina 98AG31]|uniref:F-box domain-containing protein n=1 Tax=Melampsora larici-populina (strain 98AG31 / pathotype 3-4-7) TaxID=747676 RepID=F4R4B2_MELLP|nr:uncharacterized protein MELLADRAFT_87041 [Melampsora larici-populina 98AG31]EGG12780.1 hypothetical protein MELLADRAFT_87041 [Melampsora larici-populina 98AG31]